MKDIINHILINHLDKINFLLIGKAIIECILLIIALKIINKTFNISFDNVIKRINDKELQKNYQTLRQLGIYITDTIIILFFMVNILGNFGIDMKPILATAGVFGVAVGFGAKTVIEDFISGLMIIITGQLRVGDYVTVNTSVGTVEKVTLTMIVIRGFNGDVHYIRNGSIHTVINQTKNYSFPVFKFSVAYKTNVVHAMDVLKKLGKELRQNEVYSRFVLSDIEVSGLDAFEDSSITILCRIKTTPHEQWIIKRKFNQMVKERFEAEGIEIPFPQIVLNESK